MTTTHPNIFLIIIRFAHKRNMHKLTAYLHNRWSDAHFMSKRYDATWMFTQENPELWPICGNCFNAVLPDHAHNLCETEMARDETDAQWLADFPYQQAVDQLWHDLEMIDAEVEDDIWALQRRDDEDRYDAEREASWEYYYGKDSQAQACDDEPEDDSDDELDDDDFTDPRDELDDEDECPGGCGQPAGMLCTCAEKASKQAHDANPETRGSLWIA
jgi:hypothetical protein